MSFVGTINQCSLWIYCDAYRCKCHKIYVQTHPKPKANQIRIVITLFRYIYYTFPMDSALIGIPFGKILIWFSLVLNLIWHISNLLCLYFNSLFVKEVIFFNIYIYIYWIKNFINKYQIKLLKHIYKCWDIICMEVYKRWYIYAHPYIIYIYRWYIYASPYISLKYMYTYIYIFESPEGTQRISSFFFPVIRSPVISHFTSKNVKNETFIYLK